MRRRPILRATAMAALLVAGGTYAIASLDFCGPWPVEEPAVLGAGAARGKLRAGAARVELSPPFPVVAAGYPPPRSVADRAEHPLHARALVLEAESVRVGLVSLDLLSVPAPLAEEIRSRVSALGLADLWVSATHTHSSFGGYDARLVSELAGTGGYRDGSRAAVVGGAVEALERAAQGPGPVTLELAERETAGLVSPRSGESSDQRLTRLLLRGPEGPIAQLVVFSAHPTLVARRTQALSPDFVGPFLAELEKEGGVALFLQGAAGNATVSDASGGPEGFAGRLAATCRETGLSPLGEEVRLGYARVSVSLPRPDSSRAVPGLFRAVGDNFLCGSASHRAELSALQLGPVKLISVPGEVTRAAASPLEERGRASRAVSLVNGYLGYVEAPGLVTSGAGESRRQYFGSGLLESFARGAELAGAHLE